jgi:hypothetical protein
MQGAYFAACLTFNAKSLELLEGLITTSHMCYSYIAVSQLSPARLE